MNLLRRVNPLELGIVRSGMQIAHGTAAIRYDEAKTMVLATLRKMRA
jgi:hypothetical protein